MRWNATIHTKRPPASNKGARWAWEEFVRSEALPCRDGHGREIAPQHRQPKEMTYKFMDYWVWVMEFTNGDFEEIEGCTVAWYVRNPMKVEELNKAIADFTKLQRDYLDNLG